MTEGGSERGVPATSILEHLAAIDDRLAAIDDAAAELELLALNADLQTAKADSSELPVVYREVRQAARRTARAADAIDVSLSAVRDDLEDREYEPTGADLSADDGPAVAGHPGPTGPEGADTGGRAPELPWASTDGLGVPPSLPPGPPEAAGKGSAQAPGVASGTGGVEPPEWSRVAANGRRTGGGDGAAAFRLGAGTPERSFVPERGRRARSRSATADDVPAAIREYALDDDEIDWEELLSLAEVSEATDPTE